MKYSNHEACKKVRKIYIDDTLVGLERMVKFSIEKPFRFVYMSGADAERDQTKTSPFLPDYFLMRVSFTCFLKDWERKPNSEKGRGRESNFQICRAALWLCPTIYSETWFDHK
jgi:hypothetical protein